MNGPDTRQTATRPLDRLVRDPALRSAMGYWDGLRLGRIVPPRMALDPAEMRPLLQQAAILEHPRPGTVRIRLAGARISALMGMEVRGMPFRALFDLADRARATQEVERALAEPAVLLLDVVTPAPRYGVPPVLRAQIAVLPMSGADFSITRGLFVMGDTGGAEPGAPQPENPHRWSLSAVERVPLRVGEPLLSLETVGTAAPATPAPLAETADEDESEERGLLARARFRVIEGGLA
jgi:hypothetical protein